MVNLHQRMLPTSAGVEPATYWSPVGRASNRATKAGSCLYDKTSDDLTVFIYIRILYNRICIVIHIISLKTPSLSQPLYTQRKKKRKVNFIPKFHSSLKKFVKYFTMITKRYMYGTKVPNFISLWPTSLELLKFIGSYPNLEIKIKLKINIGCAPLLLPLLP